MNKIIRIYCEGKKGSHDYDILEKIIIDLPAIIIEPIGSVRGASAIIQYKEEESSSKSDFKILFRDRDFDKEIPSIPSLEQDENKKYCYFSYRVTIENYLFDVELFYQFIEKHNLKSKYSISNQTDVKNKFIEAAKLIQDYQAIRHTMGKMRLDSNFGTTFMQESGKLPADLTLEYCKKEAYQKIADKKNQLENNWTKQNFDEILANFLTKFDDVFMDNLEFLVYFQGKDFAAAIQKILPEFPTKDYYKFAKEKFDYTKFTDLVKLRELLEANSN
ncbi:MAG: hypothetical protein EAZ85_11445 [Bacteroidetes bacterium]|nr:MAG: hypothetical protein EAZ85_11445 [Bacteroidota bacterium]